jgi:tetratricopeptide (TPR) repeat protein
MILALLALQLASPLLTYAAEPESIGPRSEEEADFLLRDSREAFDQGRMDDAVRMLERLIHRYPAHPEMAKSQLLLGKARLQVGQPKKAIAPLLQAVEAWGNSADGTAARLPLGRAYVSAKDPRAALVTVSELTRGPAGKKAPAEVVWEALLIQAHAHLALNRDSDAQRDLHSVESSMATAEGAGSIVPSGLRAETHWTALQLKSRECARLPAQEAMDEGQARVQYERRGACVQEAASLAHRTASAEPDFWTAKAAASLAEVVAAYQRSCRQPPPPRGKRSPKQLKRYRQELILYLEPVCEKAIQQAATAIPEEHALRKAFGSWAERKK